jgi:hypothetical protein
VVSSSHLTLVGYRLIVLIVLNKQEIGVFNYFLDMVQEETRGGTVDDAVVRG